VPWGDGRLKTTYAVLLPELQQEVFLMVHLLDNGDWFIEVGGNKDYLAAGAGKYLADNFTISGGVARSWNNFLRKEGTTHFYVGFSYSFNVVDIFKKLFSRN